MNTTTPEAKFIPLRKAAASLGVPASWLEAEAKAGRIPHLKAGRRLLFNPAAVERVLLDRAAASVESQTQSDEAVVDRAAVAAASVT